MPYVTRALCAVVPHVSRVIRALVLDVPRAVRTLVPHVLRTLRALVPHVYYVLLYLTCLVLWDFSYCSCFLPYVLFCSSSYTYFRCLKRNILICISCLVAFMSSGSCALVLELFEFFTACSKVNHFYSPWKHQESNDFQGAEKEITSMEWVNILTRSQKKYVMRCAIW